MKKSIYKITNLINNKIYIGQSIHPERRFKEHIWGNEKCISYIDRAIRKYGINNFSFEIIEEDIENYNEKEKYWIRYYNSNNLKYGYNLTSGGEEPPVMRGEDNPAYKYSDILVKKIIDTIKTTNLYFKEIAELYNCTENFVKDVNQGIRKLKDTKEKYPIRKTQKKINDSNIYDDLIFSTLTFTEIAKKYNTTTHIVRMINEGKRYFQNNIKYPIRINGTRCSKYILDNIQKDLSILPKTKISKKYNFSRTTLDRIINNYIINQKEII